MDCPVSWLPRELGILEIPDTFEFDSLNVHTFPVSELPSILFPLPGTTFPHHVVRTQSPRSEEQVSLRTWGFQPAFLTLPPTLNPSLPGAGLPLPPAPTSPNAL